MTMGRHTLLTIVALALIGLCTGVRTQETAYPITVVPPGKGPFSFPPGYQTPWDKIHHGDSEDVAEPVRAARI